METLSQIQNGTVQTHTHMQSGLCNEVASQIEILSEIKAVVIKTACCAAHPETRPPSGINRAMMMKHCWIKSDAGEIGFY